MKKHLTDTPVGFEEATGEIGYTFTNDFVFRALLQRNENVLKGLVASLLHLEISEIRSCIIKNPIELGEAVGDKDFILFPEFPEFYSRNLLMNEKTHQIFSDKMDIRVVNLNCIERATEEDRKYEVDRWARLFKATTWEEIRKVAGNNKRMQEVTKDLYVINQDEYMRQRASDREFIERFERMKKNRMEMLEKKVAERESALAELDNALAERENTIAERESTIAERESTITELEKENARLRAELEAYLGTANRE